MAHAAPSSSPLTDSDFRIGDKVSFPYPSSVSSDRFEGVITSYSTKWILIGTAPHEINGVVRDWFAVAVASQHGMRLLERGPELAASDLQECQGHVWKRDAGEVAA